MTEHYYDDHTVLYGTVTPGKSSSNGDSYLVDDFHVHVFIGSIDHDITSSLDQQWIDRFKTELIEKYLGEH